MFFFHDICTLQSLYAFRFSVHRIHLQNQNSIETWFPVLNHLSLLLSLKRISIVFHSYMIQTFNKTIVFVVQDIRCNPSVNIPNAVKTGNDDTYGSVIEYRCMDGYRFPDGRTYQAIRCTDRFTWNSTGFDCKCNYLVTLGNLCHNMHV